MVARELFDDDKHIIRIDMSEYMLEVCVCVCVCVCVWVCCIMRWRG